MGEEEEWEGRIRNIYYSLFLEGDRGRYLSGQSGSCIGRCYYQAGEEKRVYEDKTLEKENGSVVSVNLKRGRVVKRSTRSIR